MTPQFDAQISEIHKNLVPHKRTCRWQDTNPHCEGEFEITDDDIKFLKNLKVPAPNYCPTCRRMKRFVHMNLSRLSKRSCEAPNHTESIISILPPESPFPVFDYLYFISDEFDPMLYGGDYIDGVSPSEILFSLRKKFPMPSFLNRDPSSVNSEYSNGGKNLKNGYYVFGCYNSENTWYTGLVLDSRFVMDSRLISHSDYVYRSILSDHIYKSSFIYFSENCSDSLFLFDCRNVDNCFGCVNLRGGKYVVFNEQYSKEEYEEFMKSVYPLDREKIKFYKNKFWNLIKSLPVNASRNVAVENVSGTLIRNSKNVYNTTDADNAENLRHCDGTLSHHDSMDVLFSGGKSSLLYECINIGSQSNNVKFSISSKICTDSEFVFNCKNISNCFMCFGLQNKSYCILNKQYSKEEYYHLVNKIKVEMLNRGEYGDGFDMKFSAQAYNFSLAQLYFPLNNEDINKIGGYVANEPEINVGDMQTLTVDTIPRTIEDTNEDILNKAIICEVTGRPFRIISSELEFYKQIKMPIPSVHPLVRLEEQLNMAPFGKKYKTECSKCQRKMESIFDPKENYILYCEKCYQAEVY